MIQKIFDITATLLHQIGKVFNLTYNEINIIVYYLIIPLSWAIMIDILIGIPITTALLTVGWIYIFIVKRNCFRQWCDWAFDKSVDFLNYFNKFKGNYVLNSVVICVLIPILIYALLITLLLA